MKTALVVCLATLLSGICGVALAAGSGTGTITAIHMGPYASNKVFIKITGSISGQPACQTNLAFNAVFDVSTAVGKATLATLLTAKVLGTTVTYSGANQCTLYSGVEDMNYVTVN